MLPIGPQLEPPYYAVIFSSRLRGEVHGYSAMASKMEQLARERPGCLGFESARDADGFGLTVSYWRDTDSIAAWKADAEHLVAQEFGRTRWYDDYVVRVAKVERHYGKSTE